MDEIVLIVFVLIVVVVFYIIKAVSVIRLSGTVKALNDKIGAMQDTLRQMAENQTACLEKMKAIAGEEKVSEPVQEYNSAPDEADMAPEILETIAVKEEPVSETTVDTPAVPEEKTQSFEVAESPVAAATAAEPTLADCTESGQEPVALAESPLEETSAADESQDVGPEPSEEDTVSVAPREPSAFQIKLRNICNWIVYGRLEGVSNHDQLEKVLATTWLLRFGVLVILFTSAFLLKLSIDRGLLSPSGRVALSYFAGAALFFLGISHRMREKYWRFGQALIGLGFGLFYFSSFAMLGMYHLAPVWVAGGIMCLTTLAAGILSDRLNSMTIAMVAMFGGYATPAMLSTGTANFPGLSIYLALLGCGVLWLANRRNWQQLTWIAMIFAYCIFGAASNRHFLPSSDFTVCVIALTVFFIQFSTSVFLHNVRYGIPVSALEIVSLLLNSAFYFGLVAWHIARISNNRMAYAPLCLGLALFYIAHVWGFMKKRLTVNRNLLLVFCGLSALYLALTMPMVLSSAWLGSAWAIIALVVLWLEQSVSSRFLRRVSLALFGLSLFHIVGIEWQAYGRDSEIDTYMNLNSAWPFWMGVISRCLRFLTPVACLALACRLERKRRASAKVEEAPDFPESETTAEKSENSWEGYIAAIFASIAFVLLVFFAWGEVTFVFHTRCLWLHWPAMTITGLLALFLAVHLSRRNIPGCWKIFQILLIVILVGGCIAEFFSIKRQTFFCYYLSSDAFWLPAWGRLLNCAAFIAGLHYFGRALLEDGRRPDGSLDSLGKTAFACQWIWPVLLFLFATTEWSTIIYYKIHGLTGGGVSVLWAIFAFAAVFFGLKNRNAIQRYVGLGLFAVVVLKVFFSDMSHLDAMYRVIAFLVFGILLMAAAFIYFKCWKQRNEE